jgi:hypothetical protein
MNSPDHAQGDVPLVSIAGIGPPLDKIVPQVADAAIPAEGEHTGHRHALYGALIFRDDALARDILRARYIGDVKVAPGAALFEHGLGQTGDHDSIQDLASTFIALRQREYVSRSRRRGTPGGRLRRRVNPCLSS